MSAKDVACAEDEEEPPPGAVPAVLLSFAPPLITEVAVAGVAAMPGARARASCSQAPRAPEATRDGSVESTSAAPPKEKGPIDAADSGLSRHQPGDGLMPYLAAFCGKGVEI